MKNYEKRTTRYLTRLTDRRDGVSRRVERGDMPRRCNGRNGWVHPRDRPRFGWWRDMSASGRGRRNRGGNGGAGGRRSSGELDLVRGERLIGPRPFDPFKMICEDVLLLGADDHAGLMKGGQVSRASRGRDSKVAHSANPHIADRLAGCEAMLIDEPGGDEASRSAEAGLAVNLGEEERQPQERTRTLFESGHSLQ
jgi:hypothetical protein